jgi:uncharacterized protein YdeI (YjbR/CyaY-like superfamily)
MVNLEPHDIRFFATAADLRDWFDANHATADELWVGYYRVGSGRPSVSWSEAMDEALCVGWIDGVVQGIDEVSHAQRYAPRRKGSSWSAVNIAKVGVLTAMGRMRPAGIRAYEARLAASTVGASHDGPVDALTEDELARFKAEPAAWEDWEGQPRSYRLAAIHWVTSARQAARRERRLAALIEDSLADRPIRRLAWTREGA